MAPVSHRSSSLTPAEAQALLRAATLVLAQAFRRCRAAREHANAGLGHRYHWPSRRKSLAEGGWSLFVTPANVRFTADPLPNLFLATPFGGGVAGWHWDDELGRLHQAWWQR